MSRSDLSCSARFCLSMTRRMHVALGATRHRQWDGWRRAKYSNRGTSGAVPFKHTVGSWCCVVYTNRGIAGAACVTLSMVQLVLRASHNPWDSCAACFKSTVR